MTMTIARSFEEMFAYALILLAALSGLNAAGISIQKHGDQDEQSTANFQYHEDAYLNARELITKYGYRGETHRVKTKDGYILEVHRITGPKSNPRPEGKPVVFLMHGLLASSDDWLISGPEKAYAYMLADSGYDVWLGNARGNHYCRKHVRHSVLDKQFWMFSWHEIGIDDLPSMIDYVIEKTGSEKIFYAGHSQGTTSFFVMASERPEYNDKIKAMFAMAPVTYMQYMSSPFLRVLAQFGEVASTALTALGTYEFKPTDEFLNHVKSTVCDEDAWTQPMCENIIFLLAGYGTDQMNKTLLPAILGHVPAGSSARQIFHYAQLVRSHEFRQYDHGFFGNIANYKRSTPPSYDLSKVTVPVVLHYSINDCFSHVKDVQRLESKLPNIYAKLKVPNPRFAHLDYTWGIDAHRLLYSKSILLMDRLEKQL